MPDTHWTDEDFLNHLYGLRPNDAHLQRCPVCAERLASYAQRRRTLLAEARMGLPADLAAAQRRAFRETIDAEEGRRAASAWRPAVALAALILLAMALWRPGEGPAPLTPAEDQGLYAEMYESVGREEPETGLYAELYELAAQDGLRAAEPIHELFEN